MNLNPAFLVIDLQWDYFNLTNMVIDAIQNVGKYNNIHQAWIEVF